LPRLHLSAAVDDKTIVRYLHIHLFSNVLPTVLRDLGVFVEELEKINQRWEEEYNKNEKQRDEIMLASWDISAMYPSLKIGYILRDMDTLLVERIGLKPSGATRNGAKKLREVVNSRFIFILQHQFVNVRDEGAREAERMIFYWPKEGIGIGSSASGPIADITVLAGERIMLKSWKERDISRSCTRHM